jgi:hypothetical protein
MKTSFNGKLSDLQIGIHRYNKLLYMHEENLNLLWILEIKKIIGS